MVFEMTEMGWYFSAMARKRTLRIGSEMNTNDV